MSTKSPYVREVTYTDEFGFEQTATLTFKPFSVVPLGLIRKNRKNPEEGMWAIFEWALTDDDLAVFDYLPISDVEEVFITWQEAGEVTAGESSSSAS